METTLLSTRDLLTLARATLAGVRIDHPAQHALSAAQHYFNAKDDVGARNWANEAIRLK